MILTSELVPKTAWYSNVRSNVSKTQWDIIRKKSYKQYNNVCGVCGDNGKNQGFNHAVECHEIFEYDDINHIQKLTQLISLCCHCHFVKHPGLAKINGNEKIVISQLMKVNSITENEAALYIENVFNIWTERSKYEWKLDITYLDEFLKK